MSPGQNSIVESKYLLDYNFTTKCNRDKEYELIYYLLSVYAFRISEILSMNSSSLVPPNTIIVKLKKCPDYYVFHDKILFGELKFIFDGNFENRFSINYKEIYRWIIKNKSQDILIEGRKRAAVTHSYRYRQARAMKHSLKNEKQIKALLRHRSIKTQNYYLSQKSSQ